MFNSTPLSIIEIGQVRNMNNKVLAYKGCFYKIMYKIGDDYFCKCYKYKLIAYHLIVL